MAKTPRISAHGRVANGLASGLAVTLLLSPLFVPPCDGTMPMRCHWTFEVEWLLAVSVVGVAASLWFVRRVDARRVIGAVLAWFGVLVIAVTQSWVVGLCGHSEMACHHTAPVMRTVWPLLLAFDFAALAHQACRHDVVVHVHDPWESSSTPPPIEAA